MKKPAPVTAAREKKESESRLQEPQTVIAEDTRSGSIETLANSGGAASDASGKASLNREAAGQPATTEALAFSETDVSEENLAASTALDQTAEEQPFDFHVIQNAPALLKEIAPEYQ